MPARCFYDVFILSSFCNPISGRGMLPWCMTGTRGRSPFHSTQLHSAVNVPSSESTASHAGGRMLPARCMIASGAVTLSAPSCSNIAGRVGNEGICRCSVICRCRAVCRYRGLCSCSRETNRCKVICRYRGIRSCSRAICRCMLICRCGAICRCRRI